MVLTSLRLHHFRSYAEQRIDFPRGISVLYGDNGQGKTNVLEAVFLLATGRSHRTARDMELLQWGENQAVVHAHIVREDLEQDVRMLLQKGEKKRIWIGGQPAARIGELFGHVSAVLFSPEDLRMVKDGPQMRRRFLDMELSQLKPAYFFALQRYHRALRQRNALLCALHEKPSASLHMQLDAWEAQLAEHGLYIEQKRLEFVGELCGIAATTHARLTGGREELQLRLQRGVKCDDVQDYARALREARPGDLRRQVTMLGPHRDDIVFAIDGHNARDYASQGQQRTIVLALKLAEMLIMREQMGEWPLLMLDDVMSELDPARREQLLSYLTDAQILIAVTDLAQIPGKIGGCFHVQNGSVERVDASEA